MGLGVLSLRVIVMLRCLKGFFSLLCFLIVFELFFMESMVKDVQYLGLAVCRIRAEGLKLSLRIS